jgi:hypothetical protein
MKRNLSKVAILLRLIETHADEVGILLGTLKRRWKAVGPPKAMRYSECFYLLTICKSAGLITEGYYFTGQRIFQLTWAGHEYLDSFTDNDLEN